MSEYTPITGELRELLADINWTEILDHVHTNGGGICDGDWLDHWHEQAEHVCDVIDSVHAQLERENADLRMKFVNVNRHARHVERENESLKAELDRVLGEQEEHAHTRGESITGELREVAAKTECANGRCEKLYRGDLERIADRIDVEHKRAVMSAMNDALYHANDESMAELGWVRLPKDADRVPIFIGDVMESDYITRTEVAAVGIKCFFAWSNIDRRWHQYEANQFRHHAPDTWERIIKEVLQRGHDDYPLNVDTEPYVARCKALCERTKEDA